LSAPTGLGTLPSCRDGLKGNSNYRCWFRNDNSYWPIPTCVGLNQLGKRWWCRRNPRDLTPSARLPLQS